MIKYKYITSLLLFVALCSCDVAPKDAKKTNTDSEAVDDKPTINTDKQALFFSIEKDVKDLILKDKFLQAMQFVEKGISKSTKAGRDYEIPTARFLLLKGRILLIQNKFNDARRFFADAMAIFRVRKDNVGQFEIHLAISKLEESNGNFSAAENELQYAKKLISFIKGKELLALFTIQSASLATSNMDNEKAAKLYLEAITMTKEIKADLLTAKAYVDLATNEEALDKNRESKKSLKKALKLFEKLEDKSGQVKALHKLAMLEIRDENNITAKKLLTKVVKLYTQLGRFSDATKVNQHLSALP